MSVFGKNKKCNETCHTCELKCKLHFKHKEECYCETFECALRKATVNDETTSGLCSKCMTRMTITSDFPFFQYCKKCGKIPSNRTKETSQSMDEWADSMSEYDVNPVTKVKIVLRANAIEIACKCPWDCACRGKTCDRRAPFAHQIAEPKIPDERTSDCHMISIEQPKDWMRATDTQIGSEMWHEGKLWVVEKIEHGKDLPQVFLKPKPLPRPNWHQSWMDIAHVIGKRSYDPRLQVGAIVVAEDNTIMLSNGYNGNFAGGPNTPDSIEPGKSGFIHAEVNALIKCPYHYPVGKVMYVTDSPCTMCAKCIVNAKIGIVIYDREYRDTSGVEILRSSGISVYKLSDLLAQK